MPHAAEGFVKILENVEKHAARSAAPEHRAIVGTLVEKLCSSLSMSMAAGSSGIIITGGPHVTLTIELAARWMLAPGYSPLFRGQGERMMDFLLRMYPSHFTLQWAQSTFRKGYPLCEVLDMFAKEPFQILFANGTLAAFLNNVATMVFDQQSGANPEVGRAACRLLLTLPARSFTIPTITALPVKLVEWTSVHMQRQDGLSGVHSFEPIVSMCQRCWSLAQSAEQAAASSGVAALRAALEEEALREARGAQNSTFAGAIEVFLPAIPEQVAPYIMQQFSSTSNSAATITSVLARVAAIDQSGSYTVTAIRGLAQMHRFDILLALGHKVAAFVADRPYLLPNLMFGHPDPAVAKVVISATYPRRAELAMEMQALFEVYTCLFCDVWRNEGFPRLSGEKAMRIVRAFAWSGPPGPSGLCNLGNTCFANSVLQCLFHTREFRHAVLTMGGANPMRTLFAVMALSSCSPISHHVELLLKTCPLANGRQQDASEFMRWIFDAAPQEASRVMTGRAKSTVTCGTCGEQHHREDDLLGLTLEMKDSVQASLDAYSDVEVLQGEEAYRCEKCGTTGAAAKVLVPQAAEGSVILTLKRFRWSGKDAEKITRFVDVDACITMKGHQRFCLNAAVVHLGSSLQSGHFVAYAREGLDTMGESSWWKFNDDSVSRIQSDEELKQALGQAYILFYRRTQNHHGDEATAVVSEARPFYAQLPKHILDETRTASLQHMVNLAKQQ